MIPESISAIYYLLDKKGWIFQLIMFIIGVGILPIWLKNTPDELEFLPFLSCGSLLFVAAAPLFRLRLDGIVHYSSAIVCGVCTVLWMVLMGFCNVFLPCFAGAVGLSLFRPKLYMWWLEWSIIIGLIISLLM